MQRHNVYIGEWFKNEDREYHVAMDMKNLPVSEKTRKEYFNRKRIDVLATVTPVPPSEPIPPIGPPPTLQSLPIQQQVQGSQEENTLCIVCMSERKAILFGPCNHVDLCGRCAKSYCDFETTKKCPRCRGTILSVTKIFI